MTENQRNGQQLGKPFVKGDPRINRHGRPQGFDLARKLALEVGHEEVTLGNGQRMSVVEAILRSWVLSKEPQLQIAFIECAFGKVPPAKAETTGLEGRTHLILHLGHEEPELRRQMDGEGTRRPLLPGGDQRPRSSLK